MKEYSIVIDFGGTFVKLGCGINGEISDFDKIESRHGEDFNGLLEEVSNRIYSIIESKGRDGFLGIGIAMPGIVDFNKKKVISINKKYEEIINFDFIEWAKNKFNCNIVLENDAKAALKGELAYGVAKDESEVVLFTLGTGIGTAASMEGKILRGKHHQAGCLGGHITTNIYGNRCTCGNLGCVEAQASTDLFYRMDETNQLKEKYGHIDYKIIFDEYRLGNSYAKELAKDSIKHWGAGIVNLIHVYDPEKVVLSGGILKSSDIILPKLQDYINENAWTPWGKVELLVSKNPQESVLLGLHAYLKEANQEIEYIR